jgi:hypothetical protein
MDNEHTSIDLELPNRCPSCGRRLEPREAVTIEPDALEPGKAKGYHPDCYRKANPEAFADYRAWA